MFNTFNQGMYQSALANANDVYGATAIARQSEANNKDLYKKLKNKIAYKDTVSDTRSTGQLNLERW